MPRTDIEPALDRFQEAHFWIHMLEEYYHSAEPFRWHLNVFLKAIKEVPDLVSMALQNHPGFPEWYRGQRDSLKNNPLLFKLSKHRDFVVHRGMLELGSSGYVGITEGRGLKFGFNWPIHPKMDSDEAMDHFIFGLAREGDVFGFLSDDEDSLPCVERSWKIPEFDDDIIDLCATAWLRVGEMIVDTIVWLGGERSPLSLDCRHSSQRVQFKLYNREQLRERVEELRAEHGFEMPRT